MYSSSLVSKFTLWGVQGRLFSMGSPGLWHPWEQSPGQNSSSLQNITLLALAALGGREAMGTPHSSGKVHSIGTLLRTIYSPSKCAHWEACGTWVGSWWRQSLPMTQRSEGRRAFWYVKLKKENSFAWDWEKKEEKNYILINPEKSEVRRCLENQQQSLGCGNKRAAGRGYGRGRYRGSKPELLPKIFYAAL